MGKREDGLTLLRSGMSPGAIRHIQGVTLSTILGYLDQLVGRGFIRRSDILFSVPVETRREVFRLISELISDRGTSANAAVTIAKELKCHGIEADKDDIEVALRYRGDRIAYGDMYDDLRRIEIGLHEMVRFSLEDKYGAEKWWRQAVPLGIRQKCVSRREEDDEPNSDPYGYTDLLDVATIAEKEWKVVGPSLPQEVAANRKQFVDDLKRLNRIRRMVMHPIRGPAPSEDDFQFVHELKIKLNFWVIAAELDPK